jgi:cytochrome c1
MLTLPNRAGATAVVLAVLVVAGCLVVNRQWRYDDLRDRAEALTGGNVERGRHAFIGAGCGGCHTVEGVAQAHGLVGPPLDGIAVRAMIAGKLANTPANLERWISSPQSVNPGTAMPDMPLAPQETRDIAAFLYTRAG